LSTTSSAQLDTSHEPLPQAPTPAPGPASLFALQDTIALKEEVAARLAAHRARRQRNAPAASAPIPIATPARARAARIAAAVAERYAHSESYRSYLAAEAQSAIRQAEAAAEVAAVTARAVTEAQLSLLEELDQYSTVQTDDADAQPQFQDATSPAHDLTPAPPAFSLTPAATPTSTPATQTHRVNAPITVRLYEDVAPSLPQPFTASHLHPSLDPLDDESLALDDEIAFRQSPVFPEPTPTTEIPANLIEFPRQLVAARRARPRIAEGPLREDATEETAAAQLRIFEVEPAQLSSAPALASAAPEWSSILLDAQPIIAPPLVEAVVSEPAAITAHVILTAPLELRIMSAAVDTAIVLSAQLAFTLAAVLTIGSLPALQLNPLTFSSGSGAALLSQLAPLALAAGFTFLFLTALYQLLFFTFAEATPGMKYARIGLCTFTDENPTRAQMRRRILASLLSACPLGLGFLWSWIDTDRLGWHDRISRMYQRSY
jgi:uncharacterized RDD family membrane protein YckC